MSKILDALNDRQREAVLVKDGPLIVLAGAGSGKTKMLTSRIAYLIEAHRIQPYQILAMTFTNKAAAEMKERVNRLLSGGATGFLGRVEIGTFHSVCLQILRREAHRTPFTRPFVIYDDSDQLSLIKGVAKKLDLDEKTFNPKALQAGINRAKCDAVEPHEMETPPQNPFARNLKHLYEEYQKDLFANNAVDFGEIICMTQRLLRDHLDLREKYQKRFQFIHVDEYQDTNRAQYLLLSLLASKAHGGHSNICVVGDEDQSIYKWRGADIQNILNFEKEFPGAKLVKLEQNYRSTKNILTIANQVIQNNRSRKHKILWTENEEGYPAVSALLPDERAEAEMVVSEIKRLSEFEAKAFSDFALFYRTNAQSRQFEDILRREKIPYQIVGGLRFYDRKEIKDVLAYFKVILNPFDSVSLRRIINVPTRGIGKTTLEKLDEIQGRTAKVRPLSYWEVLEQAAQEASLTSPAVAKKLSTFVQLIQKFIAGQTHLLLSELYHLILDEIGYVRDLRSEGSEESLARIENLEEFNTLLLEFEEEQLEDLPETEKNQKKTELLYRFLEQSTLASDVDSSNGAVNSVKMMTLHSSKGLEFPVVFMVGMEEGLFPSIKGWEEPDEEEIEEERRLCYVGMTRARERLYLTHVGVRRMWGEVNHQEPSRFFLEIPDDRVEKRDFSIGKLSQAFSLGSSRQFARSHSHSDVDTPSLIRSTSPTVRTDPYSGTKILHPEYGQGVVIAADGSGNEQKVTIQFGSQKKKFLLRYVTQFFVS